MTASAGAAAADTESRQSAPATDAFAAARAADRAARTPRTGPASKERFTMTHPDIFAALGRERVNTFLSEAQAARQASLARAARPSARAKRVVLRDGSTVLQSGAVTGCETTYLKETP